MGDQYEHILYGTTQDGITTITLKRPEVRNAFNRKMGRELQTALDRFGDAQDEMFCILTGAGSSFCAGEDLKNIDLKTPREVQVENTEMALGSYHEIIFAILETPKPIVAALNGSAAGAGLSIALACDERFALCAGGVKLVPGFATLGLVPDAGMIPLLERLVGYSEVKRWLKPGFGFNLEDHRYHETVMPLEHIVYGGLSRLTDFVFAYAREFMELRSLAEFGATKTILNAGMLDYLENCVFPLELVSQVALEQGEDFREGLAAFKEKRAPRFN